MTELIPKVSNHLIVTPDQNPLLVSPGTSSQGWKTTTAGLDGSRVATAQPSLPGFDPVVEAAPPDADCISNCGCIFKYFISPDDTTDNAGELRPKIAPYQIPDIFGILKTMLWMAISIGLSLLIGNFC